MYSNALSAGISPSEFWDMSAREVAETVKARIKHEQDFIYYHATMIRIAVLSVFSAEAHFPRSPEEAFAREKEMDWKNSYNYLKALSSMHKPSKKQKDGV